MKYKYLIAIAIATIILPQITLAAWWNPTTWKIWSVFRHAEQQETQTQKQEPENTSILTLATTSEQAINKDEELRKLREEVEQLKAQQKEEPKPKIIERIVEKPVIVEKKPVDIVDPNQTKTTPSVSIEQKETLKIYLNKRFEIVSKLLSHMASLSNRNVHSYSGVVNDTIPKIESVYGEILILKIPTVPFDGLLVDDKNNLRKMQENLYSIASNQKSMNAVNDLSSVTFYSDRIIKLTENSIKDWSEMNNNLERIKLEIRKTFGEDYMKEIGFGI